MKVTTITCTGDRQEAFSICEGYLSRQTVKPHQMLVLDDGVDATKATLGQDYHYWPEMKGRGSLVKKIRRAMGQGLVTGDAIVFAEDDDWIPPDYLEWCIRGLSTHALFGEGRALYYNVKHRWWFEHANLTHASLCATSLTREAFPHLINQVTISECPFLDVRLWNKPPVSAKVADPYRDGSKSRHSVGIKAMPGRVGYGGGHVGRDISAQDDPQLAKLKRLIGEDADNYAQFYDGMAAANKPLLRERNLHTHLAKSAAGHAHGPNWLSWLGHLRGEPGVVGAEVGTFEGDSAQWMLDNIFTEPTSRYHCIDPFTGSIEHHVRKIDTSRLEKTTRAKLARYPNVEIHKGYSENVLRKWGGKLDFIYIDGSHTTRDVLRDAVLAFDLLNHKGVAVFDDLNWGDMPNELDRPRLGIESFVKCYAKHLKVLTPNVSQLAIQKID